MKLRKHQEELRTIAVDWQANGHPAIKVIAHVVPGGGKSWLPKILMDHMPSNARIMWCVPRRLLVEQAVTDVKGLRDIEEGGDLLNPCRGSRGFVLSHSMLSENILAIKHELQTAPYFVVIDEVHHAGVHQINYDRSKELAKPMDRIEPRWYLLMTGTLERNDSMLIDGIAYESRNGKYAPLPAADCDHFIQYKREHARHDNAIVPIEFHHLDGTVTYRSNSTVTEAVLSDDDDDVAASRKVFVGLETAYASQLAASCLSHFRTHGRKLLIVCHSQDAAKQYHKSLSIPWFLAITENADAKKHVREFKAASGQCALVTCQMAYEGLDCQDITHICSLTHIRSVPWIYQMLGRAWRAKPGKNMCWCFCPDDSLMNDIIQEIQADDLPTVPQWVERGNGNGNGSVTDVLPLDGVVDAIRRSMLDGVLNEHEGVEKLYEIVDERSIPRDHPAVVALIELLSQPVLVPPIAETVKQKETRLRCSIARRCRQLDWDHKADPGTHQLKLFRRLGFKSIKEMSVAQLERAWDVAQSL